MKKRRIEYVHEFQGHKEYFFAEDDTQAEEMILKGLNRVQDVCEHAVFKDGKCTDCRWVCDHEDIEDGGCLLCGEAVIPDRDGYEEDKAYQDYKESA